jgi:hypothetical protein
MRDALLQIALSSNVVSGQVYYRTTDLSDEKLIIMADVYTSDEVQANIETTVRSFVTSAGVRLIAVEGCEGPISPGMLDELRAKGAVSKGVLRVLEAEGAAISMHGVDDMQKHLAAQAASRLLTEAKEQLRARIAPIRTLHLRAQEALYPEDVRRMRATPLGASGEGGSMSQRTKLMLDAAAARNIAMPPSLRLFAQALEIEDTMQWDRVHRERDIMVRRLAQRVMFWLRPDRDRLVNLREHRAGGFLEFWARQTGMSQPELEQAIEQRGLNVVLVECRDWLRDWLMRRGMDFRLGLSETGSGHGEFFREIFDLCDRVGIPYVDLQALGGYVRYVAAADNIDRRGLFNELKLCPELIVRALQSAPALWLYETEDQLDLFLGAALLHLSPEEAARVSWATGQFTILVHGLIDKVPSAAFTDELRDSTNLFEAAVAQARVFYESSLERGQVMARRTLELMQAAGIDRAVLIAGGFHPPTIARALEDHRRVSWTILTPHITDVPALD